MDSLNLVRIRITFNFNMMAYDGGHDWNPSERLRFMESCVYPIIPVSRWDYHADTVLDRVFYETVADWRKCAEVRKLVAKWDKTNPIYGISIHETEA